MRLVISNRSGVPIYEQIKNQVKEAIFAGEISEDEMLPSIRQLARDLKISVITTTRAYSDLEDEGFVVNVQGKGCFVLPQNKEMLRENALKKIEEHLEEAINAAKAGKIARAEVVQILDLLYEEEE